MTTDDFNKKLDGKIALLTKENKPLFLGVKSIMAIQSKRIWLDGKNKEGSPIGSYKDRKDIYISPKSFTKNSSKSLPAFPLKGKAGKDTFKNGNKHKTGYFKSYPDFKKSIGRNKRVKTVDLFVTGDLASDWANSTSVSGANAVKVSPNVYYVGISKENFEKVDRYNGNNNLVFGLSLVEKGKFLNVVQTELGKFLK